MADTIKTQRLTVYLAKPAFNSPSAIIDGLNGMNHISIAQGSQTTIDVYVPSASSNPPSWTKFFDPHIPATTFGDGRSVGALVIVSHLGKMYALTFGTGRFKLKADCWEESFGLKVALNCIGTNVVKSIDKHTLDSLSRHTREQASREATASEFGLDVEQDLLRAVTGTPTDPRFGKWISGTDTLHLSVPVTLMGLPDLLEQLHDQFLDTSYQKNFPWVDQIAQVRDVSLESNLDATLVQQLRTGIHKQIWMAVPEVISWDAVGGFRFPGLTNKNIEFHDIHLQQFLDGVGDPKQIDVDTLKSRRVECVDTDGRELKRWKVHRCLYAELDYQDDAYLLSAGNWYRVRRDFVKQINDAVKAIPEYEVALPAYSDATEGKYVLRVAQADQTLAAMDSKTIMYGGGSSKIEFCDLLTAKRDLIHIKRYGQSAALSHLFAQGLTSGELFQTDAEFRKLLNPKLPVTHSLSDPSKRPAQGEYRVVFAIVSDRPGKLVLPFFSRLNLKHASRRLEGFGFRVGKAKIEVDPLKAKLQKIRPRKRAA